MKSLFAVLFLFVFILSTNSLLMAQSAQGNVFVVTNFERAFTDNGSNRELDSLATLYMEKCFGPDNEYVVSYKLLRHWWGHNNRDFIQVVEVKTWDDVTKANQRSGELFEKAWPTEAAQDAFNDAYNKYFTGKHSDEIYSEVVAPK
jgi:hypothetical protein